MRLPSRAKDAISEHTGLCRMSRIRVVSARTAETEPGQRFGYSFTNQDQNGHVLAQEKTRVWSYVYQSRRCAQKKAQIMGHKLQPRKHIVSRVRFCLALPGCHPKVEFHQGYRRSRSRTGPWWSSAPCAWNPRQCCGIVGNFLEWNLSGLRQSTGRFRSPTCIGSGRLSSELAPPSNAMQSGALAAPSLPGLCTRCRRLRCKQRTSCRE